MSVEERRYRFDQPGLVSTKEMVIEATLDQLPGRAELVEPPAQLGGIGGEGHPQITADPSDWEGSRPRYLRDAEKESKVTILERKTR